MSKFQPTGTKKIGIRFTDNDFYYTITGFLRVLLPHDDGSHRANDLTFTKAQIVELFNRMAYPLYLLKQNCWKYQSGPTTENQDHRDQRVPRRGG